MPRRTSSMSAPIRSERFATSLMKLIFVANGVGYVLRHLRAFGRHDEKRFFGPKKGGVQTREHVGHAGPRMPTTTRSGFMKSSIAAPSFKNSGLLATSQSRPVNSLSRAWIRPQVPTGTVLLVITIAFGGSFGAIWSTTVQSACRSAEPSAAGGVPMARKTCRLERTAGARSVVNLSRPALDCARPVRLARARRSGPRHA